MDCFQKIGNETGAAQMIEPRDDAPALPDLTPTDAAGLMALFHHGASAVCAYDAADRITCWNERYLEFFPEIRSIARRGLPFEVTARAFLEIQHPGADPAELASSVANALERHRNDAGPLRYQRADTGRWLELRMFVQPDGGRIKLWTDVSLEHQQASGEEGLLPLMTVANAGLIVHGQDGRLRYVNARFFSEHFLRVLDAIPDVGMRRQTGLYWQNFGGIFEGDPKFTELAQCTEPGPLAAPVTLRARTSRWYRIQEQEWQGGVASIWTDVTELVEREQALKSAYEQVNELNARLRKSAETDSLTDLPNRRRFEAELQGAHDASPMGEPCAVGILDLDHFKSVNDRYGHRGGDDVLTEAARRLRSSLRPGDFLARLGGEEFALILRGATGREAIRRCNELAQGLSSSPFDVNGSRLVVTASVGVASLIPDSPAAASLHRADMALFAAKAAGRNRVVLDGEPATP